jgi:surface protein
VISFIPPPGSVSMTKRRSFLTNDALRKAVLDYCSIYTWQVDQVKLEYGPCINDWDVSNVRDFSYIFYECKDFNEDISRWDVSNAISMAALFCYAGSFNQSLSNWNVSSVTNMRCMFNYAKNFNQDLS